MILTLFLFTMQPMYYVKLKDGMIWTRVLYPLFIFLCCLCCDYLATVVWNVWIFSWPAKLWFKTSLFKRWKLIWKPKFCMNLKTMIFVQYRGKALSLVSVYVYVKSVNLTPWGFCTFVFNQKQYSFLNFFSTIWKTFFKKRAP